MELSAPEGADLYHSYISRERRTLTEVSPTLNAHSNCQPIDLEYAVPSRRSSLTFLLCACRLHTCLSSCLLWRRATSASRVALRHIPGARTCVSPSSITTRALGGTRPGLPGVSEPRADVPCNLTSVCDVLMFDSSWLASLIPGVDCVPLLLRRGSLRLPADPAVPVILVGPGTGIAPLRALLQERCASAITRASLTAAPSTSPSEEDDTGETFASPLGPSALLFGCRHPEQDWLYHDELHGLQVRISV